MWRSRKNVDKRDKITERMLKELQVFEESDSI